MKLKDGVFYLQKVGKSYLAKFQFKADADAVRHFNKDLKIDVDGDGDMSVVHHLSAIKLTYPKVAEGKVIPELPDLKHTEDDDFDLE